MRTRQHDGADETVFDGEITVAVRKGAGGARGIAMPRASLVGLTHAQVVETAVARLGENDPFSTDVRAALDDTGYSLERMESGAQSHWVNRGDQVDNSLLEQQELRYTLSRDHVGGR